MGDISVNEARLRCQIAEIKAICYAADDPASERYTDNQAGLVHLIADIRAAVEGDDRG